MDYHPDDAVNISEALTDCIDNELLCIYQVANPNDINHPTRACKVNRQREVVKTLLSSSFKDVVH